MPGASLRIIRDEHLTLGAVLLSIGMMIERGPKGNADSYFDVLRAMLFYIDELPERHHHPIESSLLFPLVERRAPETAGVISRLESEHVHGESAVRELQHLLLAWELIGESSTKHSCGIAIPCRPNTRAIRSTTCCSPES